MIPALATVKKQAAENRVGGKHLSPFLMDRLNRLTRGKVLQAYQAILVANARLAAQVAGQLANGAEIRMKVAFRSARALPSNKRLTIPQPAGINVNSLHPTMTAIPQNLVETLAAHANRADAEALWPADSWETLRQTGALRWAIPPNTAAMACRASRCWSATATWRRCV